MTKLLCIYNFFHLHFSFTILSKPFIFLYFNFSVQFEIKCRSGFVNPIWNRYRFDSSVSLQTVKQFMLSVCSVVSVIQIETVRILFNYLQTFKKRLWALTNSITNLQLYLQIHLQLLFYLQIHLQIHLQNFIYKSIYNSFTNVFTTHLHAPPQLGYSYVLYKPIFISLFTKIKDKMKLVK